MVDGRARPAATGASLPARHAGSVSDAGHTYPRQ